MHEKSCFQNWLQIAFPYSAVVSVVEHWFRKDCCPGRNNNVEWRVGDTEVTGGNQIISVNEVNKEGSIYG